MGKNVAIIRNIVILLAFLATSSIVSGQGHVVASHTEMSAASVKVEVFPNPTTDYIYVRLGDLKADDSHVTLHSIIGNQVNVHKEKVEEHLVRIPVKGISPGYYFVTVRNDPYRFKGVFKTLVQN